MILASSLRLKIKGKKNHFSQAVMQVFLTPELEQLIQHQIATGKYQSALEVITAGLYLLEQQDDVYKGRLMELQQDAQIGQEAVQREEVLEGPIAMNQIRENLQLRHATSES
jgi:antitoxin ParD1/3/4